LGTPKGNILNQGGLILGSTSPILGISPSVVTAFHNFFRHWKPKLTPQPLAPPGQFRNLPLVNVSQWGSHHFVRPEQGIVGIPVFNKDGINSSIYTDYKFWSSGEKRLSWFVRPGIFIGPPVRPHPAMVKSGQFSF